MDPLKRVDFQMHYSEKGRKLTQSLLESADPTDSSDAAILSCLLQIEASPETTEDEKLLAGIGIRLKDKIAEPERQAARLCVLNAINGAVPGPSGAVFAGLLINMSHSIGEVWERNLMRIDAFKSLSGHPGAAPDVRTFADFVEKRISIGAQSVNIVDRAHQAALKILTAPLSGPVHAVCIKYLFDLEKPVAGLAYGESMLHAGLRHFYDNPETPPGRHALALSGLHLPDMDIDNDDNIDQIRRSYLRALTRDKSDYLPSTTAGETLTHLDELEKTEAKSYVLNKVFQAIRENPDSSELHKALAMAGEGLSSSDGDDILLQNQKAIMEAIAALPEKPSMDQLTNIIGELRGRVAGHQARLDQLFSAEILASENNEGTAIINDEDFVYIEGLRLERKSEEPRSGRSYSHLAGRRAGRSRSKKTVQRM